MANYKYLIFDAQYFLTRNCSVKEKAFLESGDDYVVDGQVLLKPDGTPYKHLNPTYTTWDVVRSFYQSIAKFTREIASCEKVILVWDKYPYHKSSMVAHFKTDRDYPSEEKIAALDPVKDAATIIDMKYRMKTFDIKQHAKYWMIEHLSDLGVISFIKTGYEADDYAGAAVKFLSENDPMAKIGIVSIDSDWDYLLLPNAEHLRPKGGSVTFEQVAQREQLGMHEGMSLYTFKAYCDALYGSHNFLLPTVNSDKAKEDGVNVHDIISEIEAGNYSHVANPELFNAQFKCFDYTAYPEYDKVVASLHYMKKAGRIMDILQYSMSDYYDKLKISPDYYSTFVETLNSNLYND